MAITETVITRCDKCADIIDNDRPETRFSVAGQDFAIDLCDPCHKEFGRVIEPYVVRGRAVKYTYSGHRKDGKTVGAAHSIKPKRKRRTKAEMEAARAEAVAA